MLLVPVFVLLHAAAECNGTEGKLLAAHWRFSIVASIPDVDVESN